jgi:hypothetical protein
LISLAAKRTEEAAVHAIAEKEYAILQTESKKRYTEHREENRDRQREAW